MVRLSEAATGAAIRDRIELGRFGWRALLKLAITRGHRGAMLGVSLRSNRPGYGLDAASAQGE
jgi:hypothetical protein